jgi:Cdc6-like AAA superfamily ATPase
MADKEITHKIETYVKRVAGRFHPRLIVLDEMDNRFVNKIINTGKVLYPVSA